MPATVTTSTGTKVSTHEISLTGTAGIMFWSLFSGLVLYCIGFATTGWSISGNQHRGLWEHCRCWKYDSTDANHAATQAMATIGLIGLILSGILCGIYMFFHRLNKNIILIATTVLAFVSMLFMLIAFIIWGVNESDQSYSFAFCVIAAFLTLVAGIVAVVQIKQSNAA